MLVARPLAPEPERRPRPKVEGTVVGLPERAVTRLRTRLLAWLLPPWNLLPLRARLSPREDGIRPRLDTADGAPALRVEVVGVRRRRRLMAAWLRARWAAERRLLLLGAELDHAGEERFHAGADVGRLVRAWLEGAWTGVRVRLRSSDGVG